MSTDSSASKSADGRIARRFAALATSGRKGLITFVTAGDPTVSATPVLMHALVRGGADVIELGVPFSDPMADGEVIQRASERALAHGTNLDDVLNCVAEFRQADRSTPVVLMGYLNPYEHMGAARFAARAAEVGVDGVLVVDLPPEEATDFNRALTSAALDQIFLVAPNSPESRMHKVCEAASGFVYFVSVKGVTGGKAAALEEIAARIELTRQFAGIPVGIGFGIRTPETAARAAAIADAVIIGSAIVEVIEQGGEMTALEQKIESLVADLRAAIDSQADAA
ncbi:MAG: tryptophan synthase subunit alpha [Gammaproteobacteria bacterium]